MENKKLKKFLILFDNESLLYFPGSFLSGQILVECEEDLSIYGLHFTIIGEGVVRPAGTKKVKKRISENYINFRMQLLGDNNFNDPNELGRIENTLILPSGVHSFPFKLGLPVGIPSTFVGKHGWVQYYCKIALKDATSTIHKNQQVFIVMNPIDLNLENKCLIQPIFCELIKKVGRFCSKKGTVICRVRLDRGGYVPGESIKINARVENHSRVTLKSSKATLNETIKYLFDGKILHSENKELASLERGKIRPDSGDEFKNELLYIPPIPPTNLRNCHIINIEYFVSFIVQVNKDKTIRMRLPILLGTYPIRNADGTLKKKKGSYFPQNLPVSRLWLEDEKKIIIFGTAEHYRILSSLFKSSNEHYAKKNKKDTAKI